MKTRVINFRTTKQLIKDIERLVEQGHYRNKTEAINDALRLLREKYISLNSTMRLNSKARKR